MDKRILRVVTITHLVVLCLFMSWGCVANWMQPKPIEAFPVEFVVDVTPPSPDGESMPESEPEPPEPEPEPEPTPIPELVPDPPKPDPPKPPEPKPEPPKPDPPKPPKPKIEVSKERVIRKTDQPSPPKSNPLTAKQIRDLLNEGRTAGTYTSAANEDSRGMALIKTTLDSLWIKPSKASAGDAEAFLKIWIEPDGRISKAELSRRSGNPELDASVEAVGQQAKRLHGLSAEFIRRHATVTIAFQVK